MGRLVAFVTAMTIGVVALLPAPVDRVRGADHRYADDRAAFDTYVHPTGEQLRIRRWLRLYTAELARPVPVPVDDAPRPSLRRYSCAPQGEIPGLAAGELSVELRVVDAGTGEAVTVDARLWRLRVPGNERYTPGDEVRWKGRIEQGELTVSGLPEGWYRLECPDQRRPASDPAAFPVDRPTARALVRVSMPRALPVRARVFLPDGTEVTRIDSRRCAGGSRAISGAWFAPDWAEPREPIGVGRMAPFARRIWRLRYDQEQDVPRSLEAGPSGFELGSATEADRYHETCDLWTLSREGCVEISCRVDSESFHPAGVLVAPLVPLSRIAETTRLPDGRPLSAAGVEYSATCRAVAASPRVAQSLWREAEVEVRVQRVGMSGHHVYRWRLGEPGAGPIVERLEDTSW